MKKRKSIAHRNQPNCRASLPDSTCLKYSRHTCTGMQPQVGREITTKHYFKNKCPLQLNLAPSTSMECNHGTWKSALSHINAGSGGNLKLMRSTGYQKSIDVPMTWAKATSLTKAAHRAWSFNTPQLLDVYPRSLSTLAYENHVPFAPVISWFKNNPRSANIHRLNHGSCRWMATAHAAGYLGCCRLVHTNYTLVLMTSI